MLTAMGFVERNNTLKVEKASDDPIYFMAASPSHHYPVAGFGWTKYDRHLAIRSNTVGNASTGLSTAPGYFQSFAMMTKSMLYQRSNGYNITVLKKIWCKMAYFQRCKISA
jgi:hypothetical protein